MTPSARPSTFAPAVLVLVAMLGWLVAIDVPAQPMQTRTCTRPLEIDGLLRCDDEVPATLAALCGEPLAIDRALVAGDRIELARACAGDETAIDRMDPARLRALAVAVDVNTASIDELRSLPGIGPVLASRIVEGRPYASVDDLLRVRGIGEKTLAKLRARLRLR